VKIGPVDHEIALLNLKKKKKINASKIYSPVGRFAERAKQGRHSDAPYIVRASSQSECR